MRILIAAIAALILSALQWLAPAALPAALIEFGRIAVPLLLLCIVIDAGLGLRGAKPAPAPVQQPQPRAAPKEEPSQPGEALVLLSLLQEKGRFIDYLMEDITSYGDAQVAAASRVVHQGCASVIKEYLEISPVHAGSEGDKITIDKSSDPHQYRLSGKVAGEPPFSGVVLHRGWKTAKLALPRFTRPVDPATRNVIAPAEVEVR